MTRWWGKAGWVLAVAFAWSFVAGGAADNFVIENTQDAVAAAEGGQQRAAVAAVVLAGIGALVPLLDSRFSRAALGLVVGSAVLVLLTSGSELVLVTGLLSALPLTVGVVLALVPARPEVRRTDR
jgi:hypothetical protein